MRFLILSLLTSATVSLAIPVEAPSQGDLLQPRAVSVSTQADASVLKLSKRNADRKIKDPDGSLAAAFERCVDRHQVFDAEMGTYMVRAEDTEMCFWIVYGFHMNGQARAAYEARQEAQARMVQEFRRKKQEEAAAAAAAAAKKTNTEEGNNNMMNVPQSIQRLGQGIGAAIDKVDKSNFVTSPTLTLPKLPALSLRKRSSTDRGANDAEWIFGDGV
ncbi:MAG: hypothetical protein M1816_007608 [Peltula sp. TS41687]|nr:MAG: hypothetical protein M1816_007608 [Peltula sp. TS41687]